MKRFGLIGKSLAHSFSPTFFQNYFAQNRINAKYELFELETIEEVKTILSDKSIAGINVTVPYKIEIIPFLDEIDSVAKTIGAVNVVAFKEGKTIGFNTDAYGFQQSIKPFLTFKHERALILGTGGASKAIEYVFKQIGIDVIFISQNPNGKPKHFSYSDINDHMLNACKVIVNCTPVGTYPNNDVCVEFPFQFLSSDHLVIDLIYNPAKTKFLSEAEKKGATILNGESMLKEQALKSWEIWEG
ncbi:MAG: shikimate dehydrogenase [Flavobacteriales bacterium]|nr:shikimate dehydrogenase [Flavobacteriales bacterium]